MPYDTLRERTSDGWEQGVSRGQWLHRERVAAVYRVGAEFVASADETWLAGTWPTFDQAAAAALASEPMTWDEKRRAAEADDAL